MTVVPPAASVEVATALFWLMYVKMSFRLLTSEFATSEMALSFLATVRVTGVMDAAVTLIVTPGSRSENVLVDEVTVWAAPVPDQRVTWAS